MLCSMGNGLVRGEKVGALSLTEEAAWLLSQRSTEKLWIMLAFLHSLLLV